MWRLVYCQSWRYANDMSTLNISNVRQTLCDCSQDILELKPGISQESISCLSGCSGFHWKMAIQEHYHKKKRIHDLKNSTWLEIPHKVVVCLRPSFWIKLMMNGSKSKYLRIMRMDVYDQSWTNTPIKPNSLQSIRCVQSLYTDNTFACMYICIICIRHRGWGRKIPT